MATLTQDQVLSLDLACPALGKSRLGTVIRELQNGVPSSGELSGHLTGSVTGNVTGNVTGSSGSCTGNAATATSATTASHASTADSATSATSAASAATAFGRSPATSLAEFTAAVAAKHSAGGGTVHVTSNVTVNAAVSTPSDVRIVMEHAAKFVFATGGSLAFAGPFEAPDSQVFSGFAAGNVTFAVTSPKLEWFGASGGGSASDASACSSAIAATSAGESLLIRPPPVGYLVDSQLNLKDYLRILGGAPGKVKIKWAGTSGRCLDFESVVDCGTVLDGLMIDAQSGVTDHVIQFRNSNAASSSAAGLQLRDCQIGGSGIPVGKASLQLLGIKSLGGTGEGNVYSTSLWNCRLDNGGGTGLLLDYLYGTGGTTLTNSFASSFSGNGAYGIHGKNTGNDGGDMTTPHGIVNLIGSLLQGNVNSAIHGDIGPLNLVGSYIEHPATSPLIDISGNRPCGPMLIVGSTLIGPNVTSNPIAFAGYGASGMLIAANNLPNPASASGGIGLTFVQNSLIGPNKWTGSGARFDFAGSSVYGRCLELWDPYYVAFTESSGNIAGGGAIVFPNDAQWIDTTSIGIGVTTSQISAYFHVRGFTNSHNAPDDHDGDSAHDAMLIEGGVGQAATTAGKTSGTGGSIKLHAGAGGSSIALTNNGNGGNVELIAGAAGSGDGTAAEPGYVLIGSTGHTVRHWGAFSSAPTATPVEGDEYYDLTSHTKKYWNGSTWA